ncbi:hypothetical protein WJX73_006061 [Symbiochloris irregularis]|uniref:Uncharacterized protein n=1 Tax=Symbiochloris irregularis TaxID=706552 RepID=A0AAW1NP58_9CHLO
MQHDDLVVNEVNSLLERNDGTSLPHFLVKLYQTVLAFRAGQYAPVDDVVVYMREYRHQAWLLAERLQDPSLEPAALANAQTEMKLAAALLQASWSALSRVEDNQHSRATVTMLRCHASAYASLPTHLVLSALKAQWESMQLSKEQAATIAMMGLDLFAQLRTIKAGPAEGMEALHPSAPTNAKLLAAGRCIGRCTVQLGCAKLLSDEQFIRWQAKRMDDPVMHHLHPMLLVLVHCCLQQRAPRLPGLKLPRDRVQHERLSTPAQGLRSKAPLYYSTGNHSKRFRYAVPLDDLQDTQTGLIGPESRIDAADSASRSPQQSSVRHPEPSRGLNQRSL